MEKIDFVIIWVDGNDADWQAEKAGYSPDKLKEDASLHRYRDWDNLQYWFRGVEKYAPWVNKIHFVTCGHLPKWLNVNHPKLNIVRHSDYIPEEYLPTFNSHTIELNLHRIKGLSENFVYFNDDTFIIDKVKSADFFKNGLPCDTAVLNPHCYSPLFQFHFTTFRNIGIINKYFNMKEVLKKNFKKWFNLKYGKKVLQTVVLSPCPRFPGMWMNHMPNSYKKSTFEEVWSLEEEELVSTCKNKFRNMLDYSQWLFKEWQIAKGEFYPRSPKTGMNFELVFSHTAKEIHDFILKQKRKMICINDYEMSDEEYEKSKSVINSAFDRILPEKSEFEL